MLKVDINKDGSKPVVHASGNIMEILNDIAIMTSALYTQFQAADAPAVKGPGGDRNRYQCGRY